MFGWDDLRYFLEVSRRGRLVGAAQRLGVDHTTVSRRIANLEQSLNTQLFDRTPSGYTLTEAGRRLLAHAELVENTTLAIQADLAGENLELSGSVRVSGPEGFMVKILTPAVPHLRARHPEIELEVVTSSRYASLSRREADLLITLNRPTSGRLVARKLADYRLCMWASEEYLDSNPKIQSVEDLEGHDLVGYVDDLIYTPQLRYLDQLVEASAVKLRSTSLVGQLEAAKASLGLCVLPCFMAEDVPGMKRVLVDEICINREFWIVQHEDLRHVARIRSVFEFIVESVDAQAGRLLGLNCQEDDAA